ncbi:MAG: hypothetical protein KDA86_10915 [Planctomycetaceae bacterium]|nr:hypothetical protein [Planctomycetaceae bacterium]
MGHPSKAMIRRFGREERRQRLIDALKELAERLGPDISITQFYRETGINDTNVYLLFENWADLRVQAGLPPRINRRKRFAIHTKEQLLDRVKQAAEKFGEDITVGEFTRETGVTSRPITRLFGTWLKLKEAAGLHKVRPGGQPVRFTHEELVERLRELVKKRGDISRRQFCREVGISNNGLSGVVSWGELRKAIGLPPRVRSGKSTWEKEHLAQIPEVKVDLFAGLNLDDVVALPMGGSAKWQLRD